jgi:hypothetical protein
LVNGACRPSKPACVLRRKIEEEVAIGQYGRLAVLQESRVHHTIVRATQFHPLLDHIFERLTFGPFLFTPGMTFTAG